jgi:type IV pilus assembly protein PilO
MRMGLRETLLLGVLLALPLCSYWMVFKPQNAEIGVAKREIDHKRQILETLRQRTVMNDDMQRENEEIRTSILMFESRLPSNKEVDSVVRQVSDLAVESGLAPPSVESQPPVAAAMYMEQPLKMRITGDFRGFHEFLRKLEMLPRITRIPDMKITRAREADGHMHAEFTLSIYFQSEGSDR